MGKASWSDQNEPQGKGSGVNWLILQSNWVYIIYLYASSSISIWVDFILNVMHTTALEWMPGFSTSTTLERHVLKPHVSTARQSVSYSTQKQHYPEALLNGMKHEIIVRLSEANLTTKHAIFHTTIWSTTGLWEYTSCIQVPFSSFGKRVLSQAFIFLCACISSFIFFSSFTHFSLTKINKRLERVINKSIEESKAKIHHTIKNSKLAPVHI